MQIHDREKILNTIILNLNNSDLPGKTTEKLMEIRKVLEKGEWVSSMGDIKGIGESYIQQLIIPFSIISTLTGGPDIGEYANLGQYMGCKSEVVPHPKGMAVQFNVYFSKV